MKTIFQNVIILSLMAFAFGACKKKSKYTAYQFSSTTISANGGTISFNGNASGGSDQIIDCGVILSTSTGSTIDNASQKISLGAINTSSANAFHTSFNHLNLNTTYYTKGYVKDDKGYTYSGELTAVTNCLTVDSISPKTSISTGNTLTIYGKNFGIISSNIVVTVYNDQDSFYKSLTPTSTSNNVLNVTIPSGFTSGDKISFDVKRTDTGCIYDFFAVNIFEIPYQ